MKKVLAVLLAAIMILTFAACSSQKQNDTTDNSSTGSSKSDVVDENLLTVDITVPASMFDEENPASAELSEEQKEQGFKSAKLNDDGSVTYSMSKSSFKKFKETSRQAVIETLDSLHSDFPCVVSTDFNDDFSEIKIYVNKSEYENGMNFLMLLQVGFAANIYQTYTNETVLSNVYVIDKDTNETLNTATYPVTE